MPTLAEILGGIDSVVTPTKRRLSDLLRNPLAYSQQALGNVGDNMAQFSQNALKAQEGQDLTRMGSMMGDAPQYKNALSSTINGVLGIAPVGMVAKQYSPDMSAQQVAKVRAEFHKAAPTRDLAEREFSQWLAKPVQLSAEDIAATRSWFHENSPTRDLAERQFSHWLIQKGLLNP